MTNYDAMPPSSRKCNLSKETIPGWTPMIHRDPPHGTFGFCKPPSLGLGFVVLLADGRWAAGHSFGETYHNSLEEALLELSER